MLENGPEPSTRLVAAADPLDYDWPNATWGAPTHVNFTKIRSFSFMLHFNFGSLVSSNVLSRYWHPGDHLSLGSLLSYWIYITSGERVAADCRIPVRRCSGFLGTSARDWWCPRHKACSGPFGARLPYCRRTSNAKFVNTPFRGCHFVSPLGVSYWMTSAKSNALMSKRY